jgi:hypothetical protein
MATKAAITQASRPTTIARRRSTGLVLRISSGKLLRSNAPVYSRKKSTKRRQAVPTDSRKKNVNPSEPGREFLKIQLR